MTERERAVKRQNHRFVTICIYLNVSQIFHLFSDIRSKFNNLF